jgi:hypothetical protein
MDKCWGGNLGLRLHAGGHTLATPILMAQSKSHSYLVWYLRVGSPGSQG